jgi:hypothetical protein
MSTTTPSAVLSNCLNNSGNFPRTVRTQAGNEATFVFGDDFGKTREPKV